MSSGNPKRDETAGSAAPATKRASSIPDHRISSKRKRESLTEAQATIEVLEEKNYNHEQELARLKQDLEREKAKVARLTETVKDGEKMETERERVTGLAFATLAAMGGTYLAIQPSLNGLLRGKYPIEEMWRYARSPNTQKARGDVVVEVGKIMGLTFSLQDICIKPEETDVDPSPKCEGEVVDSSSTGQEEKDQGASGLTDDDAKTAQGDKQNFHDDAEILVLREEVASACAAVVAFEKQTEEMRERQREVQRRLEAAESRATESSGEIRNNSKVGENGEALGRLLALMKK